MKTFAKIFTGLLLGLLALKFVSDTIAVKDVHAVEGKKVKIITRSAAIAIVYPVTRKVNNGKNGIHGRRYQGSKSRSAKTGR